MYRLSKLEVFTELRTHLDLWHKYLVLMLSFLVLAVPADDISPARPNDSTLSFRLWILMFLICLFVINQQGQTRDALDKVKFALLSPHNSHQIAPLDQTYDGRYDVGSKSIVKDLKHQRSRLMLREVFEHFLQKCLFLLSVLVSAPADNYDGLLIVASFVMALAFLSCLLLAFGKQDKRVLFALCIIASLMHSAQRFFHMLSFHPSWSARAELTCGAVASGVLGLCGRLFSIIFLADGVVCGLVCLVELAEETTRRFCARPISVAVENERSKDPA